MDGFSEDIRIVTLELFDAAFPVAPDEEERTKQRFMTLFQHEEGSRRGGGSSVHMVTNLFGETFALKRYHVLGLSGEQAQNSARSLSKKKSLRKSGGLADVDGVFLNAGGSFSGANGMLSGNSGSATPYYVTQGHVAVLYEEYRIHMAVANLRGFPKLYGFGLCDGDPVIVMEWVEGVSLSDYMKSQVDVDAGELLPLQTVADFGIAVLTTLSRAAELEDHFVHRDISPRNVIIRTDRTSARDQFSSGQFDLCLIDFGSSSLNPVDEEDASFTLMKDIWRMGTPSYAPPEMLTSDVVLPQGWRQSETIDTYALCSVLYELYGGHAPYRFKKGDGVSPYRLKTEQAPRALVPREPDGGALANIIATGLSAQQPDRPTVAQLKAALENWKRLPAQKSIGQLRGSRPVDSSFWQPGYARKAVTRRAVLSASLVAVAAIASGIVIARKSQAPADTFDPSRYTRAEKRYVGAPLYKAFDGDHPGWMLCARDGSIVCKPDSSRECGALRGGLVAVYDDVSQRYGYITPDESSSGYAWFILPAFAQALDFSEERAGAQSLDNKLWGFIDSAGDWAVPAQFNAVSDFTHGIASVQANDEGALWGAIRRDGSWVADPRFSALGSFSEAGFAVAQDGAEWGVFGLENGFKRIPGITQLRSCAYGPAPAFDVQASRWGFVNVDGSWAIEPVFLDARPFYPTGGLDSGPKGDASANAQSENESVLAAVQDAATLLWYFIGIDGLPNANMEPRFWKLGDFHDGLAPAQASAKDSTVVFDESDPNSRVRGAGKRYGYVDATGNWQLKRLTTLTDTAIGSPSI